MLLVTVPQNVNAVCVCVIPEFASMLWKVPVTVATKSNPEAFRFVLEQESDTVTLEGVGPDDWVLVRTLL